MKRGRGKAARRLGTERELLISEVATLYYQDELSQEEIAQRLGISRSAVSRMLKEAKREGIVEIHINYHWLTDQELQNIFSEKYGLRMVRILKIASESYERILRGLGDLTARYLEGILKENAILAIGWGTAVHKVVEALRPVKLPGVQIVQMIGAVGKGNPFIDGPELARILAQKLGGKWYYLHAPLLVRDERIRKALMAEPAIRETLALASQADVAIVGIGSVEPSVSSLLRAGYVTNEELEELKEKGAVGDICARHFDIQGNILDVELNKRVIGISIDQLRKIKCVIGVAGGKIKAPAILGALRGKFIDALVTDSETAKEILKLEAETKHH